MDKVTRSNSLEVFFSRHPVFTVKEMEQFLKEHYSGNVHTRKALLTYYRNRGRIIPLRRGLYASVPPGSEPETYPVDPFLITAKLTDDAVLAYHTALEYYGKAYSTYRRYTYTSLTKSASFHFKSNRFLRVPVPKPLRERQTPMWGIESYKRAGIEVHVTTFERTFVDCLDRPDLTGSWEEIWRSLESIEFFDLDAVLEYTIMLDNATTASKTGYFLEQHKESLLVEDRYLEELKKMKPKQPHYMVRGNRAECRMVKGWNLLVPEELINQSWSEVI
jgi:predicted transcriptional regulator of viral defense system